MKQNKGKVVAVSVSTKRGVPKTNKPEVLFVEDSGIEGDAHAGAGIRQVSLLANESIDKMREKGADVRPGAFGENITTESIDIPGLEIGQRLNIGQVCLEITKIGKECLKPCAIYDQVGDCVMPREGVFARVLTGGVVRAGDKVEVLKKDG